MSEASFTWEELVAALHQNETAEGYYTRGEWQERLGVHTDVAMIKLLKEAQKRKLLDVSRGRRECLDGVSRMVPVYRIRLNEEG